MTSLLRAYGPLECGEDGYPLAWHSIDGGPGIKHLVRATAGHRCVRCRHPYTKGAGEWSPCDEQCSHGGPIHKVGDGYGDPPTYDPVGTAGRLVAWGNTIEAQWRILTVHHLTGEKADCRWWNLAALCQRCHLQIQGRVQMGRVWPWEHSEWFQPYVAGWYAWTYLGEDLTRDQVVRRMDELLALERIA